MGIKGASILSSHPPFDMCAGVVIDMMHDALCVSWSDWEEFNEVLVWFKSSCQTIQPQKKGIVDMFHQNCTFTAVCIIDVSL